MAPFSATTAQIAVTGPGCRPDAIQQTAFQAAIAYTVYRGFDRFVITGSRGESQTAAILMLPIGSMHVGVPIMHHSTTLTIRMFRTTDPGADEAIDARGMLGPNADARAASIAETPMTVC